MKTKILALGVLVLALIVIFIVPDILDPDDPNPTPTPPIDISFGDRVDDWEYEAGSGGDYGSGYGGRGGGGGIFASNQKIGAPIPAVDASMGMGSNESIGFSVGGAKDINNFRENIKNDYLPLPTDITYEGLFYDYYFDTGQEDECDELFCPSYSYAVTADPLSEDDEYYLAVGLNSGIKESDFERKRLNLIIVLDISGSMSSPFDKYYYDQFGNYIETPAYEESNKTKMEVATESIVGLLGHLNDDDKFGMVLFDDGAYMAKQLGYIGETDMDSLEDHILDLMPQGGTYMSSGMEMATDMLDEYHKVDQSIYENRIIFLTDAQPNIGELSEDGLLRMMDDNSNDNVHTTFIGIGVDFNTELIESITKTRGANYYSVHSSRDFKKRMDDEFEYMVTPLVFDLKLELDSGGYRIDNVYGSPEADKATGRIMYVNTLFPSSSEDGETKGGIVLIKLLRTRSDADMELTVSYEDREGREYENTQEIILGGSNEHFDNDGIRKAVLLSRYADLMKNWTFDERNHYDKPIPMPLIGYDDGIIAPEPCLIREVPSCPPYPQLGRWERESVALRIDSHYKDIFEDFAEYFEDEMKEINDRDLNQELDILKYLIDYR
ncbi:MAG: VWA domain-containing protein [Parcubacteria group bacterium]